MKKVTLQEVFDRVATHLLTQNAKSVRDDTAQCMYRGDDGLMCAVGCLIPDDLYKSCMDSGDDTTVTGLLELFELSDVFDFEVIKLSDEFDFKVINVPRDEFVEFLAELQQIHDVTETINWKFNLQTLAERNKLEFRH